MTSLVPTVSGLERDDASGLYRRDDAGDWTSLVASPQGFYRFLPTSATGRLWFGGEGYRPALLDTASGTWRLPEDPCGVPPRKRG